ncbi:MAG: tRNA dihydrouridine synthase DusB [Gammaproteobacteria bacterium]|nr:MAG: tRNA dihydrouridine synthase DusB [Gammaproteobacteria bacterium]
MQIGNHSIPNRLILAPMAGITDAPFRATCQRLGAGLAVSEMISADPRLRFTTKTRRRTAPWPGADLTAIQIVGAEPRQLAQAAAVAEQSGAPIIDINLGCPAKKVCRRQAGSALLRDEGLVGQILEAVVAAVEVPVTLKIRTGWDPASRNAVRIAKMAEDVGVAALTVHGRTRACGFRGQAEYQTIRNVKQAIGIPVIANGDIDTPEKARAVLAATGADALMIGRGAQGNPWIFREISHFLQSGERMDPPGLDEVAAVLTELMQDFYLFYGERTGVRMARKHLSWSCRRLPNGGKLWDQIKRVESATGQLRMTREFFSSQTMYSNRQAA